MEYIIEFLEVALYDIVQISTILMELFGICVLVYTAVKCFYRWTKKDESIRLDLGQGIALALEFKMGGEVLRTVVVRERSELIILGAIILLRGALTFLIHWEIRNEKKERRENEKEKRGKDAGADRKPGDGKKNGGTVNNADHPSAAPGAESENTGGEESKTEPKERKLPFPGRLV